MTRNGKATQRADVLETVAEHPGQCGTLMTHGLLVVAHEAPRTLLIDARAIAHKSGIAVGPAAAWWRDDEALPVKPAVLAEPPLAAPDRD